MHAGVEDREPALAVGLGHVHRDVGVADQVLGPAHRVTGAGDPDARGDDDRPIVDDGTAPGGPGRSRSAIARDRARSGSSSVRIANSSPPSRATRSVDRTRLEMRSVTATSSASPAAWPSVSLTTLKSSRSMNRTAVTRSASLLRRRRFEDALEAELEHPPIGRAGQRSRARPGPGRVAAARRCEG